MTTTIAPQKEWQVATLLMSRMVAADVMSLTFSVENWQEHVAGQHYDIRLTSESGYQAERSYSVASPPEEMGMLEFGVQLLPGGEVSPYLFALQPGEQIEVRGPIGGHFTWDISIPGPLVLIGGGSGMVPLICMLRHHIYHFTEDTEREIIFLVSARSFERVLYRSELENLTRENPKLKIVYTLTDSAPEEWTGYRRRIDQEMFKEVFGHLVGKANDAATALKIYVCGPTPFVEVAANDLVTLGFSPESIKTERFGGAGPVSVKK